MSEEQNAKPHIVAVPQVPGPDNEAVYQFMKKKLAGDTPHALIPYGTLNDLLGYDVQQKRSALTGAVKRLLREGIRVEAVINEGVRVLTNVEAAGATASDGRKLHRHAKRAWKKTTVVDIQKLDDRQRTEFLTHTTQMGLITEFGSRRVRLRLAQEVETRQQQLPITRAIEVMQGTTKTM